MAYQLLDIRFVFFCRTTYTNKAGECPIVLRISYRDERTDIFTGLNCAPDAWDSDGQRVVGRDKNAGNINQNIADILYKCKEQFDAMKYRGKPFTLDEFVMKLKAKDQKPETIVNYLKSKAKELKERVGIDITAATHQKYLRCIKHMEAFLFVKFKNKDISITSINNKLIMDFFYYLRTEKANSHNTSVNYIKCLKTVMMPAIKNGTLYNDPFFGSKITSKVVSRGFLSMEELGKIENLKDLPGGILQARDIFLFACYTGMAYIDIKQFSRKHLVAESDGSMCIHKPRQKTGIISIIPLLPVAQRILESYSPTGNAQDFRWSVITNQKINEHLKSIQTQAGIKQDLFFHLARHTFATTITLSNGVPLETVSKMLGHSNISMTQRYAKISGYKIKEDMKKLMGMFR